MSTLASYEHLRSRLSLALALNAAIIVAEFIGGWILNSIGLMSDAGHNLVDQGSLFLALYAHLLRPGPPRKREPSAITGPASLRPF